MKGRVTAEVIFRPYTHGGRPEMPQGNGYAPYIRTGLVEDDLAVRVINIPANAQFGELIPVSLELSYYPQLDYGPLKEGVPIQLIEGPKIVAEGVCTSTVTLTQLEK